MKQDILDLGYVSLVEAWGSDERIIEAARMSTAKGFKGWGPACSNCAAPRNRVIREWSVAASKACPKCEGKYSTVPGDEKLLKYLWKNRHATPFEMAGMVIEVKAPIFVFREWHRHRTQCLSGSTMITCVSPRGTTYKRSVHDIYQLKHGGVVDTAPKTHRNGTSRAGTPVTRTARRANPWRTRVLPNCQQRTLRVLNEDDCTFTTAKMADVWESGVKPLFALVTSGGHTVQASAEHPFFTRRGWVKMKDIIVGDFVARMGKVAATDRPIPPSLRRGIGVWTSMLRARLIADEAPCYVCEKVFPRSGLALDHVVPVCVNLLAALDEHNLRPICKACHKRKSAKEQPSRKLKSRRGVRWERIDTMPCQIGEEMTYDIEVEGPHHNYVANDLVVHNSYNEMSARYVPLPDETYMPTLERVMMANAKTTNKQAQNNGKELRQQDALDWLASLGVVYEHAQRVYEQGLEVGVPKELARLPLPVARYSVMRASANLRNWIGFLNLRCNKAAQWEIRQYAKAVAVLVSQHFSRTHKIAKGSYT